MKRKIAFVVPVLTPYSKPRFEILAKHSDFELLLYIESAGFSHRPGWRIQKLNGVHTVLVHSVVMQSIANSPKFSYNIDGIRAIPYLLPFLVLKNRPDILIVCNTTELGLCYPLKRIINLKIGLIIEDTLHGYENLSYSTKRRRLPILKKADFFIPFSLDSMNFLKNIGIREEYIYPSSWSIDLDHFANADPICVADIKNRLLLHDKLVILTVCRLHLAKGICYFLKALDLLSDNIKNKIGYIIVGSGPHEKEIREFIFQYKLKNIFLVGFKNYNDIVNYYHAADIFVLPTLQDLYSLTIMEAMASKLPVVTTPYNGARELISEGINGYIFDPLDFIGTKDMILTIFDKQKKLKLFGRKSYDIIRSYSHEHVMHQLGTIFSML